MRPVETIPGMVRCRRRRGQIKENDGGGEFNYAIFDTMSGVL
jgi:hypothetical protein